jgi:cathepsin F
MTNAYEYIKEAGGLMAAEDYPYKGSVGQCGFDPERVAVELESFSSISLDEDQIAANLVKHGPLAGI